MTAVLRIWIELTAARIARMLSHRVAYWVLVHQGIAYSKAHPEAKLPEVALSDLARWLRVQLEAKR